MHIADTKEQAVADVAFGLSEWVDYFQRVAALPLAPNTENFESLVDALNASGFAVIGTVDDAIAQVERLPGPVGRLRHLLAHGPRVGGHRGDPPFLRAHRRATWRRSFQGTSASLTSSRDWAAENRPEFIGAAGNAVMSAIQKHHEEKAQKAGHEKAAHRG